jgi:hypothetical protein
MLVRCPIKIFAILPEMTAMETCITSQVMLAAKPQIKFYYIFKEPLAISASHAVGVGGFRPPFRLTVRSVCRSSKRRYPASVS